MHVLMFFHSEPFNIDQFGTEKLSAQEIDAYMAQLVPFACCEPEEPGKVYLLYPWIDTTENVKPTPASFHKLVWWLNVLHEVGFVHCDIACRNVLFADPLLLLIDYACCVRRGRVNVSPLPIMESTQWMLDRKRARACDDGFGLLTVGAAMGVLKRDGDCWVQETTNTTETITTPASYVRREWGLQCGDDRWDTPWSQRRPGFECDVCLVKSIFIALFPLSFPIVAWSSNCDSQQLVWTFCCCRQFDVTHAYVAERLEKKGRVESVKIDLKRL